MTKLRWWIYVPFAISAVSALWFGPGSWSMVSLVICLGLAAFTLLSDLRDQVTVVQHSAVEAVLVRIFSDDDLALTQAQADALPGAIHRATGKAHDA